jgi:hypothetical protein
MVPKLVAQITSVSYWRAGCRFYKSAPPPLSFCPCRGAAATIKAEATKEEEEEEDRSRRRSRRRRRTGAGGGAGGGAFF